MSSKSIYIYGSSTFVGSDDKYHYTYRITNIQENKHYYGVRSCKIDPYKDLGTFYFSSSKTLAPIVKQNPEQFEFKILKCFKTRKEAVAHEIYLHSKFNVANNLKFYNLANQKSTGFCTGSGKYYNNGVENKLFLEDEIVPDGWNLGTIGEKLEKYRIKQKYLTKLNKKKDKNGISNYNKNNLKRANTIRNTTVDGLSYYKIIGSKISESLLKIDEDTGLSVAKLRGLKISKTRIEKGISKGENNPMFGKPGGMLNKTHSTQTKNKISESLKGKNTKLKNVATVDLKVPHQISHGGTMIIVSLSQLSKTIL